MSNNFNKNLNIENVKTVNAIDTDFVNEFALHLYCNGFLDKDWKISKVILRAQFMKFCKTKGIKYDQNKDAKIGSILNEHSFLYRSSRNQNDSKSFYLKYTKIKDYENSLLENFDNEQINKTITKTLRQQITDQKSDDYKVDNKSKKEDLQFENCIKAKKNKSFVSKIFACYICQINFNSPSDFDEHVLIHNDISDFQWLKDNPSDLKPNFKIFYQICQNPYYLKITLKTGKKNINIHRIVTVKSNSITTLFKNDYEKKISDGGLLSFDVDRHIFNSDIEQPVVVIYYFEDLNEIFIEHYFMHLKDSPLFGISFPEYLSKRVPKRELTKKQNLKDYYVETELRRLFLKKNLSKNELISQNELLREYYKNGMNPTNAPVALEYLLQMEDIATENVYINLTQNQATIKGSGHDFSVKLLNVPNNINLEDVLKPGDDVILKLKDNENFENVSSSKGTKSKKKKTVFNGFIIRIYGKTVCFEMKRGSSKEFSVNKKYLIEFRPNRLTFKYQYKAIEILKAESILRDFLFPKGEMFPVAPANVKLNIINKSVEKNVEQKEAVMNVVDGVNKLPYIIVGPPGTGKTTTIVECILQVKLNHPGARILITAGSNAACDEVAKRLLKLIDNESTIEHVKLLRLYARSVEKKSENIEENLIESSNLAYGSHFYPALEVVADYDIVVCTLSVVGRLASAGIARNFFSYCFIDECAASTEVESLVAITAVFHSKINIVVAGDPKQLGPILQSDLAASFGLRNSLMDRLLKLDCYQVDDNNKHYNRRIQTRLVRNFRTHPDILNISNSLFYSKELIPCASKELTHWAVNWYSLPEKQVPIIFDCVNGYTKRDKNSTSLYNSTEISVVMHYVKKLMYFNRINGREIKEEDIGIISPYKKQNTIIKEELDKRKWYKIATGSVETFQGQEKPIIIISTVRSIRSDKKGVGFLDQNKRLNVMFTRAQALLIIVGNPELLETMEIWSKTIDYLISQNVQTGGCNNFIQSRINQPRTNLISSCMQSLQSLNMEDNSKTSTKRRRQRRSRSLQKNRDKINSSNSIENWIEENKNIMLTSLLKPNLNSESDSDSMSIIPNPPSNDLFNRNEFCDSYLKGRITENSNINSSPTSKLNLSIEQKNQIKPFHQTDVPYAIQRYDRNNGQTDKNNERPNEDIENKNNINATQLSSNHEPRNQNIGKKNNINITQSTPHRQMFQDKSNAKAVTFEHVNIFDENPSRTNRVGQRLQPLSYGASVNENYVFGNKTVATISPTIRHEPTKPITAKKENLKKKGNCSVC